MKAGTIIAIAAAMLLFFGLVVYSTMSAAEHECEVCLVFDGREVCRAGAGATVEEAQRAAQESVCGGNVSGMAEAITCRGERPSRLRCTTR
jgi:hypothetical protein